MSEIVHITPNFAVTSAPIPADMARFAALGFRSVINNRPDGEEEGQLTSREMAPVAWASGLQYRHVPSSKLDLFTDPVVGGMAEALATLEGPILAHCKSGLRSAIVWAAAAARNEPVEGILTALAQAGFDLDFLRDELDAQADRKHWLPETARAAAVSGEGGSVATIGGHASAA